MNTIITCLNLHYPGLLFIRFFNSQSIVRSGKSSRTIDAVTGFLAQHNLNIVDSQQFGDPTSKKFFMRVHFAPVAAPKDAAVPESIRYACPCICSHESELEMFHVRIVGQNLHDSFPGIEHIISLQNPSQTKSLTSPAPPHQSSTSKASEPVSKKAPPHSLWTSQLLTWAKRRKFASWFPRSDIVSMTSCSGNQSQP